jgi:N-methylhydantoinase B
MKRSKDLRNSRRGSTRPAKADAVLVEIVRNGVIAVTEEMKSNLMRTAYSMIIYEAQDFTVGLFDAAGNTVSIGIGLPMFVRGMSETVKAMLRRYGVAGLREGDVLITNDAYLTGSHLNHITLAVPVFHKKKLVGFTACMAHWADIGAALNIVTRDIYSEGLQVPILKMYSAGRRNEDLAEILLMNVRIPDRAMGDLNAQAGAVRTGAKRFLELIARYGEAPVLAAVDEIMDRSERRARLAVAAIPDGEYVAESFMDDDAVDNGKRVPIKVRVVVAGERMTIDLSEVSKQVAGFYNSGYATGIASCQVAFKCLTSPTELPINEGSFRSLEVVLPPGKVVSATRPAPMQRWMTYPMTIIDTVFRALAPALPDRVIAGHHADLLTAQMNGRSPKDGKLFIYNGGFVGGGWGATQRGDGMSATICINDGDTHNSPVEQVESKFPIMVERYELRPDSGGAGQWQGGLGTEKSVMAESPFAFNAQIERVHCRPWGLFGGHPGAGNEVAVRDGSGREIRFPSGKVLGRNMAAGDAYILRSGGGGGYGSPLDRPLERIQADLKQGYITRERAASCYGVVFASEDAKADDGAIDADATAARREQMRAQSKGLVRSDDESTPVPESTPEGLYLLQGRLFPLRCC